MSAGYKSFSVVQSLTCPTVRHSTRNPAGSSATLKITQIFISYFFILAAIWTPSHLMQAIWMFAAAVAIFTFALRSRPTPSDLGIRMPAPAPALSIMLIASLATVLIFAAALLAGQSIPATPNWPTFSAMLQYLPWAILQEFILQSFFFLSFESILGGKRAVWFSAILFASAHIPNPVLTVATFFGALFFCEMFRRYRSLLPLGLVHAALGIALALCVPTPFLHHMRVGIGYLRFT
jgi:membrane protease YdiL (CAAX protease family)